ncbi:type VI secretion system protein TssA [Gilvimarinus sp. F26214L]|uniref:type VI secretion system protein TssA n=1 Tax=Gilvimarinus sp. DZF01 TaxID=3461371 RepID=UPI0040451FE5
MASPNIIDLDRLLAPVSEDAPAGADIRENSSPSSDYQQLKSARTAARSAERNSIHDGSTSEADEHWRTVMNLAPNILAEQSKDLEIATWYTEALLRRHGFEGLRDAFELIRGLIQNFWDDLHPMPDEDGMETRTSCLAGLNGEGAEGVLIAPIRKVSITQGDEPGPFSLWQYQQALEVQRTPDEETRLDREQKLGFTIADIERAVNASESDFFVSLLDGLGGAIDAYKQVTQLLDEHCGAAEAPPTRTIIEVLEECRGAVNHIAQHRLPSSAEAMADEGAATPEGSSESAPASGAAQKSGPVASREEAFRQLSEIARFFLKTEPHSPISYVLDKAVRWGKMSLEELMVELIPDHSSRQHFSELTGVKTDED